MQSNHWSLVSFLKANCSVETTMAPFTYSQAHNVYQRLDTQSFAEDSQEQMIEKFLKMHGSDYYFSSRYCHPYCFELNTTPYPESIFNTKPGNPRKPGLLEDSAYVWVDTEAALIDLARLLDLQEDFAVDLEVKSNLSEFFSKSDQAHAIRSYQGLTCLMQITTRNDGNFLIDTLALLDSMRELNTSFTNPSIVKVALSGCLF